MEDERNEGAGTAPASLVEAVFWRSVSRSLLERQPELTDALSEHDSTGRDLVAVLVERGLISADDLYEVVVLSGRPEVPAEPAAVDSDSRPGLVYLFPRAGEYELLEREGETPAPGETVELEGESYIVARVGRSPLPFDRRSCVHLTRSHAGAA
jgi:hypothetical protein